MGDEGGAVDTRLNLFIGMREVLMRMGRCGSVGRPLAHSSA
jgi:hypothetical protein